MSWHLHAQLSDLPFSLDPTRRSISPFLCLCWMSFQQLSRLSPLGWYKSLEFLTHNF